MDKKKLDNLREIGVCLLGEKTQTVSQSIIPTGSSVLNKALGIGGWPEGKVIELFGIDSSGKTTLALHAVAQAQKQGKTVVYVDLENTLNPDWASKLGVDLEKLLISRPENGEKAFEVINKLIELGDIGLIVVDSVAALVPSYEFANNIEDQTMGLHARLMSKGLRILQSLMINSNTTVIFINQVRDKIGGSSYIPTTITTGGRALRYSACMRVEIKKCESIKDSVGNVLGFITKFVVVKNKYGSPLVNVNTGLYFDYGFDEVHEVIMEAIDKKVLTKKGSWFEFEGKNVAQGLLQLRQKVRGNEQLFETLKIENAK